MFSHILRYLSGDIIVKALGFLSLPIYTYLIPPAEYGVFSVFLAYVMIAMVILSLNVHSSVGRFLYEKDIDVDAYISTSILMVLLSLSIFSIILLSIDDDYLSNILSFDFSKYGVYFLLLVVFNVFFSIYMQILLPQKRSKEYTFFLISKAYTVFAIITCVLYFIEATASYMIYATVITNSFFFLFTIYKLKNNFKFVIKYEAIKYILSFSVFLIPYALSGVIMSQIDRVMLAKYLSNYDVGIYSIAVVIGLVPLMLYTPISNAWIPNYFKYMDEKNYTKIASDIKNILISISTIIFTIVLFSKEISYILLNSKYHSASEVISLLAVSTFFVVLWYLWGIGIGYAKKTMWTSLIGIISAIINITLNYYLIPLYGINGAAYATIASYMFMALLGYFISKYILKIYTVTIWNLKESFFIFFITCFVLLIENIYILFLIKIFIVLLFLYLIIKFKPKIKSLIHSNRID